MDEALLEWMRRADCLLVDGTLWRDDEMLVCEVGDKLGRQMGHLAQSGPGGMLEVLAKVPAARKVLIHINNTNPISTPLRQNAPNWMPVASKWPGMACTSSCRGPT